MDIEHWMGILCHIRCEILGAEGLQAARAKMWVPPAQDAELANPHNKQIFLPLGPVGRLHLYEEECARPGAPISNHHIATLSVLSYPVCTAATQELGIPYHPMVAEYAQGQYGGLINMPKYSIFSGVPPQGMNEVQYE